MPDFDVNEWAAKHLVASESSSVPVANGVLLEEGASAVKTKIEEVISSAPNRVQEVAGKPTRRLVELINKGWGSSGFYSREVLKQAAEDKIFPAGLHMYMNHPSRTEDHDQPERRVEHLAAVLASDAQLQGDGLFAEAEIFPDWNPVIEAKADHIGLSIRAMGESIDGEAEGRVGPIITKLTEGISTDFVTHAGRGGKVLSLIESAIGNMGRVEEARNVGEWLEAFIHSTFTSRVDDGFGEGFITREERLVLSAAIGQALDSFHSHIEAHASQLFSRDPFAMPEASDLDLDENKWPNKRTERRTPAAKTKEVPSMGDEDRLSALESRLSEMEKKHAEELAEKDQAIQEATQGQERAEDALVAERAKGTIDDVLGSDEIKKFNLPDRAIKRVRSAVESNLPIADGQLDREVLEARITRAVKDEHEYLKPVSEKGKVTGVGGGVSPLDGITVAEGEVRQDQTPLTEDEKKALEAELQTAGLSESAAKTAAEV